MATRVNKQNRPEIEQFAVRQFNTVAKANGGKLGLTQIWDVQFKMEKRFGISDLQSQRITWDLVQRRKGGK
jgi:hypothetical protein